MKIMILILLSMINIRTNLNEIFGNIRGKLTHEVFDTAVRTVATTMLGEIRTRIHEQGKAADGGDIGQYSRTPMYVSANANPGKSFGRPIGKTGKSKFANGQDHKSRYFPGGYNEYKTAIGRNQLGRVNLSLSGQLNNQLNVVSTQRGYGLAWADKEKFERAGHLEKKYGKKIWSLTEDERELAAQVAQNVIARAVSE